MDTKSLEAEALWKYSYIAPLITHSHGFATDKEYCQFITSVPLTNPVTKVSRMYSFNTIKYWQYLFSMGGINALKRNARKDLGKSRRLSPAAQEEILRLIQEFPRAPNTVIREKLLELGVIDASVSQSTVDRFVRITAGNKKIPHIHEGKERKAFEFEHINDCWQADTTFLRKIGGKRVCLMLIVDDASRMVTGWGMFFEDNAVNFLGVLKNAISVYGVPSLLYMDSGAPYRNHHLDGSCAEIGIHISHAPVRDGSAKGKVERVNKTIKTRWLSSVKWDEFKTIDDVKESFRKYLTSDYSASPHSSLKDAEGNPCSPRDRFKRDKKKITYISSQKLDDSFLFHDTRKVKSDSTVGIGKNRYDIPSEYLLEKIDVFYDPLNPEMIWFKSEHSSERKKAFQTNKVENSKTVRKQHISYESREDK